jgi:hypothetical protein
MGHDLYPTPTRRVLLDAIADNHVEATADGHITRRDTGRRVTAAVKEMVQAGWATAPVDSVGPVALTALGRAIRAVRILHFGDHIVAETGPHDAPVRLAGVTRDAGRWTVTVGGISNTCGSSTAAAHDLRCRAVEVVAARDADR